MRAIVLDRRDHGLHGLFAEFLGAVLGALVEQLLRIRGLAARRGAGIDGGGKIMNGETRHRQYSEQAAIGGRCSIFVTGSPSAHFSKSAPHYRHAFLRTSKSY